MEKATRDQADVDLLGHSYDTENYSSQKRQAFDGTSVSYTHLTLPTNREV